MTATLTGSTVAPMTTDDVQRRVLRARIGVRWPANVDRAQLQDRIASAITTAITEMGGLVDVLQLDLAAHPAWSGHGPTDRVTGTTLDQTTHSTERRVVVDDDPDSLD